MLDRRDLLRSMAAMAAASLAPGLGEAAPLQKVKALGVLRVALYKDNRPWSWRSDGKIIGIDADLGAAIARALGVRLDLAELLADESVDDDLRNGVWKGGLLGFQPADVMLHIPFDRAFAARNDQVAIIAPYYRESFQFVCLKGAMDCNAAPAQFRGNRLAAEIDSVPDFYLMGTSGGVLAKDVVHFPTGTDAVTALADGRADGVLASRAQIETVLAERKQLMVSRRSVALPAFPSPGWDIGMAVRENSRNLGDAIEASVAAMATSGELKAIFDRYGVTFTPALAG